MGQLIRTLSTKLKTEAAVMSTAEVLNMQDEIENWINSLPPAYRVESPDTSNDKDHWYVILQRHYLHGMTFMVKLNPLKPYLTKSFNGEFSPQEKRFRELGVDCCLKLLDACHHLYNLEPSYSAKFHLVIFCTFDSATVLCSAILHDKQRDLPQRTQVLEAISSALRTLRILSAHGKPSQMAYHFLAKLVKALPLSYEEQACHGLTSSKRIKTSASSPESQFSYHGSSASSDGCATGVPKVDTPPEVISMLASTDSLLLPPELAGPAEQSSFGDLISNADFTNLPANDFGGLETVWDWETLNLDFNIMTNDLI